MRGMGGGSRNVGGADMCRSWFLGQFLGRNVKVFSITKRDDSYGIGEIVHCHFKKTLAYMPADLRKRSPSLVLHRKHTADMT
jgi:hypothetical protein